MFRAYMIIVLRTRTIRYFPKAELITITFFPLMLRHIMLAVTMSKGKGKMDFRTCWILPIEIFIVKLDFVNLGYFP